MQYNKTLFSLGNVSILNIQIITISMKQLIISKSQKTLIMKGLVQRTFKETSQWSHLHQEADLGSLNN